MCGRFYLTSDANKLIDAFEFRPSGVELVPNYNVAPTQQVLAITLDEGERVGEMMRWGLIPSWAKDASIGNRMINARSETVAERPSFRSAFKRRRCLIPADGFFEWKQVGKSKIPVRISLIDDEPFAFAGLWEIWRDPDGESVLSCTIITTEANEALASVHERMPVILPRDAADPWLDEDSDSELLTALMKPYDSDYIEVAEVSTLVNSPRNNSPEILVPVTPLL